MTIRIGTHRVGVYCGERVWRPGSWRRYGLFRRTSSGGFSVGPVLYYRDRDRTYMGELSGVPIRVTVRGGKLVAAEFWSKIKKADGSVQAWGHTVLKAEGE